jgi:type I protein arginine methyltransferase
MTASYNTSSKPIFEDETDPQLLGQFIPLQYHHNMLKDENRMMNFKAAIALQVFKGAKVLELGCGTGVLSCFAAATASKVWGIEFNPELVTEARRFIALNPHADKIEIIQADAFHYLPPEPVDVVICEMIHAAMLREKQIEIIESFKIRYLKKFGGKLPVFIPEAIIMAVQPLQQNYNFYGFYAPIIQFQRATAIQTDSLELSPPIVYSTLDLSQSNSREIQWQGNIKLTQSGAVNALRFITKNILAVIEEHATTIDWLIDYLVLPLDIPLEVQKNDLIHVSLHYVMGESIRSLEKNIHVSRVSTSPVSTT